MDDSESGGSLSTLKSCQGASVDSSAITPVLFPLWCQLLPSVSIFMKLELGSLKNKPQSTGASCKVVKLESNGMVALVDDLSHQHIDCREEERAANEPGLREYRRVINKPQTPLE